MKKIYVILVVSVICILSLFVTACGDEKKTTTFNIDIEYGKVFIVPYYDV